jgi:hypothetical protein
MGVDKDEELVVVWSGRDELLPPRDTQPDLTWQPPRRLYNKKPVTVTVNVTGTGPSIPDGDSDGND